MPRRRILLLAAAVCLLLLLAVPFGVRWAMTPEPGVTLENFRRLHSDMTMEEVEAVLGRPSDTKRDAGQGFMVDVWHQGEDEVALVCNPAYPYRTQGGYRRDGVIISTI